MRNVLFEGDAFVTIALAYPRMPRAMRDMTIDMIKEEYPETNKYGRSGIKPATTKEANMMAAPAAGAMEGLPAPALFPFSSYSSTDSSDRKLPTAMENASTAMKTMPVKSMVEFGTWPMSMPDKRPTVETRLSSTPKIILRR